IHYNDPTATLWAVATHQPGYLLYRFHNCGYGRPGPAGACPLTNLYQWNPANGIADATHVFITSNPCSNNALIAFRDGAKNIAVVDITHENVQPPLQRRWWSHPDSDGNQHDFEGVASAHWSGIGAGWFFYRQSSNNPCTTYVVGYVDSHLTSGVYTSLALSGW